MNICCVTGHTLDVSSIPWQYKFNGFINYCTIAIVASSVASVEASTTNASNESGKCTSRAFPFTRGKGVGEDSFNCTEWTDATYVLPFTVD